MGKYSVIGDAVIIKANEKGNIEITGKNSFIIGEFSRSIENKTVEKKTRNQEDEMIV